MTGPAKIDDWALHAYADGEVADDQRAEIEAFLAGDPQAAQRVGDWRKQKQALHQAFDGVLDEPLPPSLSATLRNGGSWQSRPYMGMAAALLLFMFGGLSGWLLAAGPQNAAEPGLASQALTAHRIYAAEVRHPVEVGGNEKDHLQNWLSKRVGTPFVVPDLTLEGYTLLGGRLLAARDGPAAQLMFEDSSRKRLTIYLMSQPAAAHETALQVERQGGLIACYWLDGKLGFVVAGEMDLDAMMKLAHIIYEKLES